MSQRWMGDGPMNRIPKKALMLMLQLFDCHEWIVAKEVGKDGYRHWQIRLVSSGDDLFEWAKAHIPALYLEKAEVGPRECRYERKEGRYWCSWDTVEVRKVRFGTPNEEQEAVINRVLRQNDRQIDLWYDPRGNCGKSWLAAHLWETCKAHYIPPYLTTVQSMVQTCASLYKEEWRPIVVIDIPRSWKWTKELYIALEAIKDGLIMDPRYSAQPINIRGVKVLVFCNTKAKLDTLSVDRWRINGNVLLPDGSWGIAEDSAPSLS